MSTGPYFVLKFFSFAFTIHLAYSDTRYDVISQVNCTFLRQWHYFFVYDVTWLDKWAPLSLLPRKWQRGPLKLWQITIKLLGTISQEAIIFSPDNPKSTNIFIYYSVDMRSDILNFLSVKPDPE